MAAQGVESRAHRPEQRASRRVATQARCWVSDGTVERFASFADVSLAGARLVTAAPPDVGRMLFVRFRLRAGGGEVCAEARVIWRSEGFGGRGGLVGAQFTCVSGADEIAMYVEEG